MTMPSRIAVMVRGKNQSGQPFHRRADTMYSHVRDAGRGLRVRGTRIGGVVALDWRRRSVDGAS